MVLIGNALELCGLEWNCNGKVMSGKELQSDGIAMKRGATTGK